MKNELNEVLHNNIPITKQMQISVLKSEARALSLQAPLNKNYNHLNTAFGGSIYSLAVLTGWGMIYSILKQNNMQGHIVIHKSQIEYLKPITSNMKAICNLDDEKVISRFVKVYEKKNVSRIQLEIKVYDEDEICKAVFTGNFVVHN